MITYVQAILIGLLQGVTELFPISSLGHTVILPSLLGWQIDQEAPFFVVFLVATHLATALVLFVFFWNDWMRIIKGFFRSLVKRTVAHDADARLAWVIIIATVPAGLLGLLFHHQLEELFATPRVIALVLIGNGFLLYGAEVLRKRRLFGSHNADATISRIPYLNALGVGVMQALALIPGFSRTGATLAGGLLAGLDHMSAARFSFLLATPIIVAAGVLKLPLLFTGGFPVGEILAGSIASAIAAWFSVTFLTRFFKHNTLVPFAVYCVIAGAVSWLVLLG